MDNNENQPWERQPCDTRQSFDAFQLFLTHPKPRPSLPQLATLCGNNEGTVGRWSFEHNWMERIQAYDDYMLQKFREETEASIIEVREQWKAWATGRMARVQELIDEGLKYTRGAEVRIGERDGKQVIIPKSTPSEIRTMINVIKDADTLMKQIAGDPTEIIEERTRNMDYSAILKRIEDASERIKYQYDSGGNEQ